MEQQQPRKYVLRTTCTKNGGFQKYQPLPPQEVFQHAFWVLGTEMDVKIKRKQRFFNRKTDWMFLPVYLTANKGLLFVYVKKDSGYILRVSSALTLNFEGNKKYNKQKNNRRQSKTQPDFTYDATIILHFQFGELRLRFKNDENLRSWRALLLAAHHTQYGVTKIGENVAKQLFPSTSLESVVSTKSVYPEVDEKDKTEKVQIHRHSVPPPPRSIVDVEEKTASAASAFTLPSPILRSALRSKSVTPKTSKTHSSFEDLESISATSTPASASAHRPRYRVSFAQTPSCQTQPQLAEIQEDDGGLESVSASATSINATSSTCSRPSGHVSLTQTPPPRQRQVRFNDFKPVTSSYIRPGTPTPSLRRRNHSLREIQSSEVSSGLLQDLKELFSRKEKQPPSLRDLSFSNQTEIPLTLPRTAFPKPRPIQIESSQQRSKVFEFWRKQDQNQSI